MIQNAERKCPYCKERKSVNNREVIICKPDAYGLSLHQTEGSSTAQPYAVHDSIRQTLCQLTRQAMASDVVEEPVSMLRVEGAAKQIRPIVVSHSYRRK